MVSPLAAPMVLSTPVVWLNVTAAGSPAAAIVGVGLPVAITLSVPAFAALKVALLAEM